MTLTGLFGIVEQRHQTKYKIIVSSLWNFVSLDEMRSVFKFVKMAHAHWPLFHYTISVNFPLPCSILKFLIKFGSTTGRTKIGHRAREKWRLGGCCCSFWLYFRFALFFLLSEWHPIFLSLDLIFFLKMLLNIKINYSNSSERRLDCNWQTSPQKHASASPSRKVLEHWFKI